MVDWIYISIFRAIVDSIYFGFTVYALHLLLGFAVSFYIVLAFVLVCCQSSGTTVIETYCQNLFCAVTVNNFNTVIVNDKASHHDQCVHHQCNHQNALEVIAYY